MKKLPDWVQRFEAVVSAAKFKPFDWASHNCVTFTAECFEAITGVDGMAEIDLDFSTKRKATAAIKKFSGKGISEVGEKVAKQYGMKEVPPGFAKRGDPVISRWDGVDLMGTVDLTGRGVICIQPEAGLGTLPLSSVIKAWSIT
jgi:hypothetical protein